eukprot:2944201-Rhodomonas_salina.1
MTAVTAVSNYQEDKGYRVNITTNNHLGTLWGNLEGRELGDAMQAGPPSSSPTPFSPPSQPMQPEE